MINGSSWRRTRKVYAASSPSNIIYNDNDNDDDDEDEDYR